MRIFLAALPLFLAACSAAPLVAVPDLAASGIMGKDCSVLRLDAGGTFCRDPQAPPDAPPFCTRSLGVVDCWTNPAALNGPPARDVADGPGAPQPLRPHAPPGRPAPPAI